MEKNDEQVYPLSQNVILIPSHPSVNTESWNSDQMHVVGIPAWGFVKIFRIFCSLLYLSEVQRIA